MGCCFTTTNAAAATGNNSKTISKPSPPLPQPPRFEEEETVKQVLSETPIISKKPPPLLQPPRFEEGETVKQVLSETSITSKNPPPSNSISSPVQITEVEEELMKNPVEENASEEVLSEMYSYSASFSAATTTTTIKTRAEIEIDEDGEVNKPLKPKIVSSTRKERGTFPSPPPARRTQMKSRNITTAQRHRNVVRREVPAPQRSRSPAIREETKQAGQIRKTKGINSVRNSGNRIPVKMTENKVNVKLKNTTNDADVMPLPLPVPLQETGESLENPLVSLECFIFL